MRKSNQGKAGKHSFFTHLLRTLSAMTVPPMGDGIERSSMLRLLQTNSLLYQTYGKKEETNALVTGKQACLSWYHGVSVVSR